MSNEELSNFIFAVDHNQPLRKQLQRCQTKEDIIKIAKDLGFSIRTEDIINFNEGVKIRAWFNKSSLNPLKK